MFSTCAVTVTSRGKVFILQIIKLKNKNDVY